MGGNCHTHTHKKKNNNVSHTIDLLDHGLQTSQSHIHFARVLPYKRQEHVPGEPDVHRRSCERQHERRAGTPVQQGRCEPLQGPLVVAERLAEPQNVAGHGAVEAPVARHQRRMRRRERRGRELLPAARTVSVQWMEKIMIKIIIIIPQCSVSAGYKHEVENRSFF
jgi:hypothetical protein